jgi:heme A synthase
MLAKYYNEVVTVELNWTFVVSGLTIAALGIGLCVWLIIRRRDRRP